MRIAVSLLLLLLVAACSKEPAAESGGAAPPAAMAPAPERNVANPAVKLAYTHAIAVEMEDGDIKPRFERAKERCESDAALGCIVLAASYQSPSRQAWGSQPASASLRVRLVPAGVEPFAASLLEPLPDERPGSTVLLSRSDEAEDLTSAILDADRHLAQLGDYRDRLEALLKRSDAKMEDLIKLEDALSTTQGQIEAITAQQKSLNRRVDTEEMTISFQARPTVGERVSPLRRAVERAGDTLAESAAAAIEVAVASLPWLLLVSIAVVLARLAYRLLRRRRPATAKSPS